MKKKKHTKKSLSFPRGVARDSKVDVVNDDHAGKRMGGGHPKVEGVNARKKPSRRLRRRPREGWRGSG